MSAENGTSKKFSLAARNRAMLVRRFGAKARCAHSWRAAHKLWVEIIGARFISSRDVMRLSVAWSNCKNGEGPAELDAIVKEIGACFLPNILRRKT